jgi:hypothetical protein
MQWEWDIKMTPNQIKEILLIMTKADGGCHLCVSTLFRHTLKRFPEYQPLAEEIWKEKYPTLPIMFEENEKKDEDNNWFK